MKGPGEEKALWRNLQKRQAASHPGAPQDHAHHGDDFHRPALYMPLKCMEEATMPKMMLMVINMQA